MEKEFLPVGSVVILKGATKKVMVTGFCSIDQENADKVYDYNGCLYPEGIINSNELELFDNEQIDQVFFRGYEDEEELEYKKILCDVINEYNNGESMDTNDEEEPVIIYQSDSQEMVNNDDIEESFE